MQSHLSARERAARQAERLKIKYAAQSRQAPSASSITRRENKYPVVHANPPSTDNAAGIDQDGTDYSYFVEVELGTKKQKMYMLVDTGAGSTWVMGSDCNSGACKKHSTFGSEDSDTINKSNQEFAVAYGSGTVKGKLTTDTISIAGMSFQLKFGLASQVSDDFNSFTFDGILGLSMSKGSSDNFLDTLGQAHKVNSNMFSVMLDRASDGANNGEIKFGGTNPAKYTGDISYTPVGKDGDWAISMDDMAYDGKKANVGNKLAYIDTGTSFIFGPPDLAEKLHNTIPGAKKLDDQSFSVPCDANKPLTVSFSGKDYVISPKDWISPKDSSGKCTSNIYAEEVVKGAWLFGGTFLKNVYTVFDRDAKKIGFASLSGASVPSSSSSSDPTTSTSDSGPTSAPPTTLSTEVVPSSASADSSSASSANESSVTRSRPHMGLTGQESDAAGGPSSTSDGKPSETNDSENSAPGRNGQSMYVMSLAGLVAALAMGL